MKEGQLRNLGVHTVRVSALATAAYTSSWPT